MSFLWKRDKKKEKKPALTAPPVATLTTVDQPRDKKKEKKPALTPPPVATLTTVDEPFRGWDISFFGGEEYILTHLGLQIGRGSDESKKFAIPQQFPNPYSVCIPLSHSFDNHCAISSIGNLNECNFIFMDRNEIVTQNSNDSWYCAQFSPTAPTLAVGGKRKLMIFENYEFQQPAHVVSVAHAENISDLDFTFDGRNLVTVSWDKQMSLWNTSDWSSKATVPANENHLKFVKLSNSNEFIATGGNNCRIKLWDANTLENTGTITKSGTMVNCSWSPCDRYLAILSQASICLWDIGGNCEIAKMDAAPKQLAKLCVTNPADGTFYVPAFVEGESVLWTFQFPTENGKVKSARKV